MYAEERECRVGDRIDQAFNEVRRLRCQLVVLAAEGDDPHVWVQSGQPSQPIAVESGTVDELIRAKFFSLGRDGHRIRLGHNPDDPLVDADLAARLLDMTPECVAHPREVNDARRLDAYGRDSGDVRLVLFSLVGADHPAWDAIGLPSPIELLESRHLREFGSHHELAADVDKDPVLFGEPPH